MTDRWRETLESLRDGFEGIAVRSRGVFHTMVERKQVDTDLEDLSFEPPDWKAGSHDDAEAAQQTDGLPGDAPRVRALTPEEAAAAPAPAEDDGYLRDKRGWRTRFLNPR